MNKLEVIEGDSFSVACVAEGEPTPQYQWSQQAGYSQLLSVYNIIGDQTMTCTVKNTMKDVFLETREGIFVSDLRVFVLYAPTTPVLSYKNQAGSTATVTNNHNVIENTTFSISCSSNSRPSPSYNWSPSGSSISNTLSLTNVRRSQRGVYTCDVSNTMKRTFSNPEQEVKGRNSKIFTLDILYAPVVHPLVSEDILEGQPLMKVCEATPGNPSITTFKWTRVTGFKTWQTQTLGIINVSRSDASYYTCAATNRMTPTVESEVIGEDSKSFFLNVWYSSSITLFTLNGDQESRTVSENDTNLPVICDVDSNPGSVITIEHDGKTLVTQKDAKHLKYSLAHAQCTDAGYYRCIGRNAYNTQPAVKEIRLFVKCSPRPSPYVPLIDRVRIGLHRSAKLTFSALSYPEPTAFQWFKERDSVLLPIEHTDNTLITSEAVNTSLTIVNVTENLFGEYLLTVHNEQGVWKQSYFIEVYDLPFPPTNFKASIIRGVLVFIWESSFNGGYEQSFLIQTSQEGTYIWINQTFIHESEEVYKTSTGRYVDVVTDLPSGIYRCRLIAINSRGIAEAVYLTKPLGINGPYSDGKVGDNGALITGVTLGLVVIGLVVCVILLVVKLRTSNIKGKYMSEKSTSRMKLPVYVNTEFNFETKEQEEEQSKNTRGIRLIHVDGALQGDGEYSSLDQRLRDNSATYDVINSRQNT